MEVGRSKFLVTLILAAALTTACSQTRFAYEHLDWYARWRTHEYVSLKPDQATEFRREFAQLWSWHRHEELPRYAKDLREIAAALNEPVDAKQVQTYTNRLKTRGEETLTQSVAELCPVLRSLDDGQVKDIAKAMDKNDREFSKAFVEPADDMLRRNSEKHATEWIEHWTGPTNQAQKDLIHQWSETRRNTGRETLEYRHQWRLRFQTALEERRASPDCERFGTLFTQLMKVADKSLAADRAYNEDLWNRLLANVVGTMDETQRDHTKRELRKLAGQFEDLAKTAES